MDILQAIVIGFVEGFTEFLPVSSTAHLIITSTFLNLQQTEFVSFFEVFIQSGAILAVIFLYWKYILENKKLIPVVLVAVIPTAIIGLLMRDIIKTVFFPSLQLIVGALIVVGIFFIVVEILIKKKYVTLKHEIEKVTYKQAIFIGIAQAFAIVPGVSRAGAVMIFMMLLGYKRKGAAIFSFLLAVPTIIGASGLDFLKTDVSKFPDDGFMLLAIGFATAAISAFIFIKWLIKYLQNHTMIIFGVYRIVLGVILLGLFRSFL